MTGKDVQRMRKRLKDTNGQPMTQQGLATALGVALSTVSAWEQGRSEPGKLTQRLIGELCRKRGVKV